MSYALFYFIFPIVVLGMGTMIYATRRQNARARQRRERMEDKQENLLESLRRKKEEEENGEKDNNPQ